MMRVAYVSVLCCALAGLFVVGCGGSAEEVAQAQATYGPPVDATDAIPAPAVAAEDSLYVGRRVTIDGRIAAVKASGCEVQIATDAVPLLVTAPRPKEGSSRRAARRTDAGDCAWQVPNDAQGVAVAAGTLRITGDTLRLPANGVRVTPVRLSNLDS